jgi:hypothetical protein
MIHTVRQRDHVRAHRHDRAPARPIFVTMRDERSMANPSPKIAASADG